MTGNNSEVAVHNAASSVQCLITSEAYLFPGRDSVVVVLPFDPTANITFQQIKTVYDQTW